MLLSPELLAELQRAVESGQIVMGNQGAGGRSPVRSPHERQLHDLTLLPTKDDPRPTFFWSAEKPRNDPHVNDQHEFPKLMWKADTGQEITVLSREKQAEMLKFGYVFTSPMAVVLDPMEEIQKQFALLSQEDQQAIMRSTNENRVQTLVDQLSKMDQAQSDAIFKQAAKAQRKAS